jgi:iron(III) transport system permease protein
MSLLVLTTIGVIWHLRLTRRGAAYETVTGKGFRQRPVRLGIWRAPTMLLILSYFAVAVAAPLLILAYASTQAFYSPPTRTTLAHMSLENYRSVIHDPLVAHAVKNSILLGVGTATTVTLMAAVASWLVVRTRMRGRWLIDALAFLPLTIPGLVLGVALLSVYLRTPWLPVYGTLWILFLAYLTRYLPFGMRYASSSMFQIARELEESAQVSGAGWWQTFRRIVLPLLVPGLFASWLYILIVSVRELGSSVLLYSPGKEVLSIAIWEQYRNGQLPELAALGIMMVGGLLALGVVAYRLGIREAN